MSAKHAGLRRALPCRLPAPANQAWHSPVRFGPGVSCGDLPAPARAARPRLGCAAGPGADCCCACAAAVVGSTRPATEGRPVECAAARAIPPDAAATAALIAANLRTRTKILPDPVKGGGVTFPTATAQVCRAM